jgi:hypothetical protein
MDVPEESQGSPKGVRSMAIVPFEQRNSSNLKALIEQGGDPMVDTIGYIQARQLVLIGGGHNEADIDRVARGSSAAKHAGRLGVQLDKQGKKLIVYVHSNQKTERGELEEAVERAVEGIPAMQNWEVKLPFIWL